MNGVWWADGDADTRHQAREVPTDDDDSPRKVPVAVAREEKHQVMIHHTISSVPIDPTTTTFSVAIV